METPLPQDIYRSVLQLWREKFLELLPELSYTVLLIFLFLGVRSILHRLIVKNITDDYSQYKMRRVSTVVLAILVFLSLFPVWLPSLRSFFAFIGIFGAGVLVVTRDILLSVGGWIYLLIRQPFALGDFVEIGSYQGEVKDIRLLETTLLEYKVTPAGYEPTGRWVHFPNSRIFTDIVVHRSLRDEIYAELEVPFLVSHDVAKIESLLRKAYVNAFPQIANLGQGELTIRLFYKDGKMVFRMRYPTRGQDAHVVQDQLWREIFAELIKNDDIKMG
ncbi:MAG: mechanosensitive ion channel family protein [Leptospiraceae bacterium]|nr:mechanosensitive ion channel family protein [Leptospiraceae bacterium]MDW8307124.1 mechanosensitive ion channel [Leptospiraceae bacterium]